MPKVEQINRFPIPSDELTRLRFSIHEGQPATGSPRPRAFILGQGLWNDLDVEASIHWLDGILAVINHNADYQDPTLLVTPNAAGKEKPEKWIATQGNEALARFEESMADAANKQGIDHLGTWNMVSRAPSAGHTPRVTRHVRRIPNPRAAPWDFVASPIEWHYLTSRFNSPFKPHCTTESISTCEATC